MASTNLFDELTDEEKSLLLGKAEDILGITVQRALEFLALSEKEHPDKAASWHFDDAVGKFKHFLREEHGWHGVIDIAWNILQPYAEEVVTVAEDHR